MTVGKKKKKKKKTIHRRYRFDSIGSITDSSNTMVEVIDSVAVVGDTNLVGGHQSHYFGSLGIGNVRQIHYFNNPPTCGSLFGSMVSGETNPAAFARATILAVRPSELHHKRLHWPSHQCW